ncbi:Polysaccharide biosynthesis protein [Geodermatophilus africanus]|uniref:Polysaccharide biosynthesis protein n=1 Tax=Geodermatophilus africanus TaxID=1137993 RepID=A0A1H3Q777_9ACTN|nr:oligosaccharide flippase family protein [Geodermatophilus africanus]SDZ09120.1 Polysaccharide biosynthesis protein [Geodermatophilus africanus]
MRRGFAWTALGRALVQVAQLANVVILARVLTPADFGLATVTASIVVISTLVADVGISTSIVHFRTAGARFAGSALSLNLLASLLVGAVLVLAAPQIASFFGGDGLVPLLYVAAAGVAASPWSVPLGSLAAQQRFGAIVTVEVSGAVLAFAVSLGLALAGAGAVSLVAGPALSGVVQAAAFYVLARQRNRLRWDRGSIRDMLGYGMPLVGYGLLSTFASNVDRLSLARTGSAFSVGLYSRAAQFAALPNAVLQSVVHRVMLPSLARLGPSIAAQFAPWRRTTHDCMLLSCGAIAVGCTTAEFIVFVALGNQWLGAASPLSVLLAGAPFLIYQGLATVLLQACGRTRLQLGLGAVTAVITIVAAVVAAREGVLALAIAVSLAAVVSSLFWTYAIGRVAGGRPFAGVGVLLRPLAFGAVVAAVTGAPLLYGDGRELATVVVQLVLGLALSAGAVIMIRRARRV